MTNCESVSIARKVELDHYKLLICVENLRESLNFRTDVCCACMG